MKPRSGTPSGKENWYTPSQILEAARAVLGQIDLDPASCEEANAQVRAAHYFDKAINGLSQPWEGRVWCNPPYTRNVCAQFVARMCAHGRGLLLTNAATDASWWQTAAQTADALCLLNQRIAFIDGDTGRPKRGNGMGQSLFCFGREFVPAFRSHFEHRGVVLVAKGAP